MARQRSRKRLDARKTQRQRQSQTRLIVGIVVVAVIIVGVLVALSLPRGGTVTVESDYEGLVQEPDRSGQGIGFALGEPTAPVTLAIYSDFSCPHCHDLAGIADRLIDEYVRTGALRVVFKPIAFVNPPYSGPAAQAAICAGLQGRFWEMHDQIWGLYDASGPGAYSLDRLGRAAEAIDLDRGEFRTCFSSAQTRNEVQNVLLEADSLGIRGTPAIYVNGEQVGYRGVDAAYNDLRNAIEGALGG